MIRVKPVIVVQKCQTVKKWSLGFLEWCINLKDSKDKCKGKVASETVARNDHLVCLLGKKPDQDSETA